jgi:hypothetical protein
MINQQKYNSARLVRLALRVLPFLLIAPIALISTSTLATTKISKGEGSAAKAEIQKIEFRWKFIKVGEMDFEISPGFFSEAATYAGDFNRPLLRVGQDFPAQVIRAVAPVHLAVSGRTNGPLRWFKNYHARAELAVKDKLRTFVLAGQDGGVDEKRVLVFALGSPPFAKAFVDSTAEEPLAVEAFWKNDTVDPLTVFEWMIFSAVQDESCAKNFWIYDGKRRYAARTSDLTVDSVAAEGEISLTASEKPVEQTRAVNCRLTLVGNDSSLEQRNLTRNSLSVEGDASGRENKAAKPKVGWGAVWPFGKADRHIDFGFQICPTRRVIVDRVEMSTPIGKLLGKTKDSC